MSNMISQVHADVLGRILLVEHMATAQRLGFVGDSQLEIDEVLLNQAIGLLDSLSRLDDEKARKIVVTVSAILWTYKQESWDGLDEYLILVLSRIGFAPTSLMLDSTNEFAQGTIVGMDSIINELLITVHQLKHEIFIGETKFLITGFQKGVWDKLHQSKLVGISAPTSAGKSFIILLKTIDSILEADGPVLYIVPTLSLVAQVSSDFNKLLKQFGLNDYRVSTTYNSQQISSKRIYVLTQEKAISAFSQNEKPFENLRLLIVDEIQNIERYDDWEDQRAKTLYDLLMELRYSSNPDLIIISGPRVDGLKELGVDIFNEEEFDEEKTKDSPVASFTYAISKTRDTYYFNQYTDVVDNPTRVVVSNSEAISGYGGVQYRAGFYNYLAGLISKLGPDSKNIIFSPTSLQARNTAIKLSELSDGNSDVQLDSLVNYLKTTVHDDYDMCITIPKGIVYHHGKTPSHVRSVIERAIRDKMIPNVACTTTLLQGVNLPAQNVIMRNPDLAIRARNGVKPKLTDYEIANLRGRAGRLLKDFIGRTFILEENSFEKSDNQLDLFGETEKTLRVGYGDKFNGHKTQIKKGLASNEVPSEENKKYAFLMTYIRQSVLKHKSGSAEKLAAVGINLSDSELNQLTETLEELEVPEKICASNRYWDPFDLDSLYRQRNRYTIPTSPAEPSLNASLERVVKQIRDDFPLYYSKHFGLSDDQLWSVCTSAIDWMKEKSLKDILNQSYLKNSDKIDYRIKLLQEEISFGLPMLLKPLYDMKAPDNMFLRFIEVGAYMPITRKMIELNVPRETAIYLNKNYFNSITLEDSNAEVQIINRLREVEGQLDYWIQVQIEGII